MAKSSPKTSTKDRDTNALKIEVESGTDQAVLAAKVAVRPTVRAAATTQAYSKHAFGPVDLTTLLDELTTQVDAVHRGDLKRAEAMLISQAHTLDAIFNELARRAALNMGEYVNATDTYMRLALKAQSQCRTTLEALSEITNPRPVAFVRQANIAHGPQQVNNGVNPPLAEPSRAGEFENQPNKLLEAKDGERLDTRAAGAAGSCDTPMETVETVDRT